MVEKISMKTRSEAMQWLHKQVRDHGLSTVALMHGIHPASMKHALARDSVTLKMWEQLRVEVLFKIKEHQK